MENRFGNKGIKDIPTKIITKKQTPETDEALMLLEREKIKVKNEFIIPVFIFIVVALIFCSLKIFGWAITFGVLAIVWLCCYFIYKSSILAPYYSLLNIAMENDEIRHQERVRIRERKRLENMYENQLQVTPKEKTKIEKSKEENIETMNKLKEENKLIPNNEDTLQVVNPDVTVAQRPVVPIKKPD